MYRFLKIMDAIKWLCIILGVIGCGAAAFLQYKKQNDVAVVKPTTAPASADNAKAVSAKVAIVTNLDDKQNENINGPDKVSIRY